MCDKTSVLFFVATIKSMSDGRPRRSQPCLSESHGMSVFQALLQSQSKGKSCVIKVPALTQNVDTLKMQIKVTLVATNVNLNSILTRWNQSPTTTNIDCFDSVACVEFPEHPNAMRLYLLDG